MTVTRDATSLKYCPANLAEWIELTNGSGLRTPIATWPLQELAGTLFDTIGGFHLVVNAITHNTAVPGWTRKGIGYAAETGVVSAYRANDIGDINAQSHLLLTYVSAGVPTFAAPYDNRELCSFGGGTQFRAIRYGVDKKLSGHVLDGSATFAGSTPIDLSTTAKIVGMRINRRAGSWSVFVDGEIVSQSPYTAPPSSSSQVVFGSAGIGGVAPNWVCAYAALWRGDAAEMSDDQLRTLMSLLNNGPFTQTIEGAGYASATRRSVSVLRFEEVEAAIRPADEIEALSPLALGPLTLNTRAEAKRLLGHGEWNHAWAYNEAAPPFAPMWGVYSMVSPGNATTRNAGMRADDFAIGAGNNAYARNAYIDTAAALDVDAATDIAGLLAVPKSGVYGGATYIVIKSAFVGGPDWFLWGTPGVLGFTVDDGPDRVEATIAPPGIDVPHVIGFGLSRATNKIRLGYCVIGGVPQVTAELDVSAIGTLANAGNLTIAHGNQADTFYLAHLMLCHGVNAAQGVPANLSDLLAKYAAAVAATPQIVDAACGRGRSFVALSRNLQIGSDADGEHTLLTRDASVQAIVKWRSDDQLAAARWNISTKSQTYWESYARSFTTIDGDFTLDFTIPTEQTFAMLGVRRASDTSETPAGPNYNGFTRFWYINQSAANQLSIIETGNTVFASGASGYRAGDQLRVQRVAGQFTYWHRPAYDFGWTLKHTGVVDASTMVVGATLGGHTTETGWPGFDEIELRVAGVHKSISWQHLFGIDAEPIDSEGVLYARGTGEDESQYVSAGVEVRARNSTAGAGELGWFWHDTAGVLRRAPGAMFKPSIAGYQMLTATRRWISPTKSVLRYFVGGQMIGEFEVANADIAGATSGITTIGARGAGGYPLTAAAMEAATRAGVQWKSGFLCNEASGNLSSVFGTVPTATAAGTPTYGHKGPRFARSGSDYAIGLNSNTDGFNLGNVFDWGVNDDFAFAWTGSHTVPPSGSMGSKFDGGTTTGWVLAPDGTGNLAFQTYNGALNLNVSARLPIGENYAAMVVGSRATGRGRIAVCDESGALYSISSPGALAAASFGNAVGLFIGASPWLTGVTNDAKYSSFYIAHGVGACTGLVAHLGDAVRMFASSVFGGYAGHFDGVIDELRVVDYELTPEEIAATWRRISELQPDGYRMMRDFMPPDAPISDDPASLVQRELNAMGQALGFASAQIENLRDNTMPDCAYGPILERWERIATKTPKAFESVEERRARVLGHFSKRNGVAVEGVQGALEELLDVDAEKLDVIAFDNTITEKWPAMRRERWTHNGVGALVTKSGGGAGVDAGVVSAQSLVGDCFVEFTVNDLVTTRYIGLSTQALIDPATYDFKIRFDVSDYSAYEFNNLKQFATGVVLNDVLRIERQGSTVRFRRNGVVYYTSTTPSTLPLRVCIGIANVGASVYDVKYGDELLNEQPAVWQTRTNVTVTSARVEAYGARIVKSSGAAGVSDAGASSVETIAGDGYVEITDDAVGGGRCVGLSAEDSSTAFGTIEFMWALEGATANVWESGATQFGPVAVAAGDVFRIERTGTTVRYRKNGAIQYTSTKAPTSSLRVDCSLHNVGTVVDNIRLYDDGARVPITWQNEANVRATGDSLRVQAVANTLLFDLHNRDGVYALMTNEPPRGYQGTSPFNACRAFTAIDPVLLPNGAEAGLVFADWSGNHFLFLGMRNNVGTYEIVYQRLRSDSAAGSDAAPVLLAVSSLTKHWLRLRPSSGSFAGTIVEEAYDFSWSATGRSEAQLATMPGIIWRRSIGWWGFYVRGSWGSPVDVRFDETLLRNAAGTRPFYWYALRDPALPGVPDLAGARAVAKRMKHGFTHASVILRRSFLCDDPNSVTDECPLGGI